MPTPIGQVFNSLAIKAGIAVDNPALKALLASPELANINVEDDLVTSIDGGLLSIDAAKNNHPDIKKKYFADAYDGIDKQLMALVATDTFDAADVEEIKAEKSTSKKQELIISKLKTAAKSAKGADKDEINRQLASAHEAARVAKAEVETVKNEYEGKIAGIKKTAALKAMFSTYKTTFDDLPATAREAAMEALINKALQDKNAEFSIDENGGIVLTGKDGSNVFSENHTPLTPQSLLDKTFAPILKVSGPPKPAAPQNRPPVVPASPAEQSTDANVNAIKDHNRQVLADMQAQKPSLV